MVAQRKTQKDIEIEEGASRALLTLVRLLARQAAREQLEAFRRPASPSHPEES